MVEQLVSNLRVLGSSPRKDSTKSCRGIGENREYVTKGEISKSEEPENSKKTKKTGKNALGPGTK